MYRFLLFTGLLAGATSSIYGDTCYVSGTETCATLTQQAGHSCDETPCYSPFGSHSLPQLCDLDEATDFVVENKSVAIAIHDSLNGFESTCVGEIVKCAKERECDGYCGYPLPDETLYCSEDEGNAYTYPSQYHYADTIPCGAPCDPYN